MALTNRGFRKGRISTCTYLLPLTRLHIHLHLHFRLIVSKDATACSKFKEDMDLVTEDSGYLKGDFFRVDR
jgi:hypothetical protein